MTAQIVMAGDTARTRLSDPITSHEAADGNDTHGARADVLFYLETYGALADHEMVAMHDADASWHPGMNSYTPDMGRVEATGIYRLTATGGKANVWQMKGSA